MQKLEDNDWDGAIFAAAGLKRLKLLPEKEKHIKLDWMIPAPAQGAVMIAALEEREDLLEICKEINDEQTATCVKIERDFLRVLEGGCTAPIGALALIIKEEVKFKGVLFSPDGTNKMEFSKTVPLENAWDLGEYGAKYILERGGKNLMRSVHSDVEKSILVYSTKSLSLTQTNSLNSKVGAVSSDFITIRNNRLKPVVVKNNIKNVLFTSQNAVESVLENPKCSELTGKPVFCVGIKTKDFLFRIIVFSVIVFSPNKGFRMLFQIICQLPDRSCHAGNIFQCFLQINDKRSIFRHDPSDPNQTFIQAVSYKV